MNGDVPMQDPIAFFITWSTYGTWLPGDDRGWVEYNHGWQRPSPVRELQAKAIMTEDACILDQRERHLVEMQIAETCSYRRWTLHAVNCRTNHVHAVLTAKQATGKRVRKDLKAWCTQRLKKDSQSVRENWWAERGSIRKVWDEEQLERVILYVNDAQDRKHLDPQYHNPTRKRRAAPDNASAHHISLSPANKPLPSIIYLQGLKAINRASASLTRRVAMASDATITKGKMVRIRTNSHRSSHLF